ncbi:sulfotransferase [Terrabacter aeriphilus]
MVFVGGLHRSGTTPLAAVLAEHPDVSGLTGTGVVENEGIYLQDVYPQLRALGGMGRFAFNPDAHLTEDSPLAGGASAGRLMAAWSPYWDLSRPVLVEKSPNNIVMSRFLQASFPSARFVMVMRHPVVVALAMAKWDPLVVNRKGRRRVGFEGYIRHWIRAHEILMEDESRLSNLLVLRYEDLVEAPEQQLERVRAFLDLTGPIPATGIRPGRSGSYVRTWEQMRTGSVLRRRRRRVVEERYGERIQGFGYDLSSLGVLEGTGAPSARLDGRG